MKCYSERYRFDNIRFNNFIFATENVILCSFILNTIQAKLLRKYSYKFPGKRLIEFRSIFRGIELFEV